MLMLICVSCVNTGPFHPVLATKRSVHAQSEMQKVVERTSRILKLLLSLVLIIIITDLSTSLGLEERGLLL